MLKNEPARLVYLEKFQHPIAFEVLERFPGIEARRLESDWTHEQFLAEFNEAHVYQIRATRSELPRPYWAHADLLADCPNLLAVSTNGSGADTIDIAACTAAGVAVVNQAGGNKEAVAEHAIGMMLCLSKRILEADRAVRTVPDLEREDLMGHDVLGKTIGIVGLGNIGKRVAEIARTLFAMRVLAHDPFIDAADFEAAGAQAVTLDALLEQSDFVTVHCPRNASSEAMFDRGAFARMKPSAYFITTARGGIHDEQALAEALAAGELAGAGLDVWEDEPPRLDHPLLGFDTVIVSPHTAGVTHEARQNMATQTIEQINDIVTGRRPPRLLNPEVWAHYSQRFEQIRGFKPDPA